VPSVLPAGPSARQSNESASATCLGAQRARVPPFHDHRLPPTPLSQTLACRLMEAGRLAASALLYSADDDGRIRWGPQPSLTGFSGGCLWAVAVRFRRLCSPLTSDGGVREGGGGWGGFAGAGSADCVVDAAAAGDVWGVWGFKLPCCLLMDATRGVEHWRS